VNFKQVTAAAGKEEHQRFDSFFSSSKQASGSQQASKEER